ncbi:cytotoxic translational repressor of toxin-antitoxin stability system [Candidatus Peregrinibacteria bacterium]|nr:MAG: cytotoxic translational repressor of toxin-antitoxin stability system [Candidatus Peregrinibacteria bacterium]
MEIILTQENILYYKTFIKDLKKIDKEDVSIIKSKLDILLKHSDLQNIKALQNYKAASYRLKIGKYRILFLYNKKINKNVFLRIKNRKDLY